MLPPEWEQYEPVSVSLWRGGKKLWPNADHIEPEDNRYSAEVKIWDRQNPKQQGLLVV
jgi:hypothetical protein